METMLEKKRCAYLRSCFLREGCSLHGASREVEASTAATNWAPMNAAARTKRDANRVVEAPQHASAGPSARLPPSASRPAHEVVEAPQHVSAGASARQPPSASGPAQEGVKITVIHGALVLKFALDELSVKSLLRISTSCLPAADFVATAAACAIANIDDTVCLSIHSLDPEHPWPDALRMLSKPGPFMNSLRCFPFVVEAGRMPEDNIVAARHYCAMAADAEGAMDPAVSNLLQWVQTAIQFYDDRNSGAAPLEVLTQE